MNCRHKSLSAFRKGSCLCPSAMLLLCSYTVPPPLNSPILIKPLLQQVIGSQRFLFFFFSSSSPGGLQLQVKSEKKNINQTLRLSCSRSVINRSCFHIAMTIGTKVFPRVRTEPPEHTTRIPHDQSQNQRSSGARPQDQNHRTRTSGPEPQDYRSEPFLQYSVFPFIYPHECSWDHQRGPQRPEESALVEVGGSIPGLSGDPQQAGSTQRFESTISPFASTQFTSSPGELDDRTSSSSSDK